MITIDLASPVGRAMIAIDESVAGRRALSTIERAAVDDVLLAPETASLRAVVPTSQASSAAPATAPIDGRADLFLGVLQIVVTVWSRRNQEWTSFDLPERFALGIETLVELGMAEVAFSDGLSLRYRFHLNAPLKQIVRALADKVCP